MRFIMREEARNKLEIDTSINKTLPPPAGIALAQKPSFPSLLAAAPPRIKVAEPHLSTRSQWLVGSLGQRHEEFQTERYVASNMEFWPEITYTAGTCSNKVSLPSDFQLSIGFHYGRFW